MYLSELPKVTVFKLYWNIRRRADSKARNSDRNFEEIINYNIDNRDENFKKLTKGYFKKSEDLTIESLLYQGKSEKS